MHIVSRILGGVVFQEGGLPARMAAKMTALPGGTDRRGAAFFRFMAVAFLYAYRSPIFFIKKWISLSFDRRGQPSH